MLLLLIVLFLKISDEVQCSLGSYKLVSCLKQKSGSVCSGSINNEQWRAELQVIFCKNSPSLQVEMKSDAAVLWSYIFLNSDESSHFIIHDIRMTVHSQITFTNNDTFYVYVRLQHRDTLQGFELLRANMTTETVSPCVDKTVVRESSRVVMVVSVCLLLALLVISSSLLVVLCVRFWLKRKRTRQNTHTLDSSLELLSCDDFEELRRSGFSSTPRKDTMQTSSFSYPSNSLHRQDKQIFKSRSTKRKEPDNKQKARSNTLDNESSCSGDRLIVDTDSLRSDSSLCSTTERLVKDPCKRSDTQRLGYMKQAAKRRSILRQSLASVPESENSLTDPFM